MYRDIAERVSLFKGDLHDMVGGLHFPSCCADMYGLRQAELYSLCWVGAIFGLVIT